MPKVDPDCDVVLKVIMIGNSGVGKSALLKCFMGDAFNANFTSTIGVDFEIKSLRADGKRVNLQIWDTAGQERFRTITTSYYRSSDAIVMAFDVTDKQTFLSLDTWLGDVKSYARPNVEILLVGNKVDLGADERQVSFEEANSFAQKHGMCYVEASAKQGTNVNEAFTNLAKAAVDKANLDAVALAKTETIKATNMAADEGEGFGCCV